MLGQITMSEEATAEAEAKTFDAKITELGDSITSLTLKEAVDLADYMKDAYGIEPAAGGHDGRCWWRRR